MSEARQKFRYATDTPPGKRMEIIDVEAKDVTLPEAVTLRALEEAAGRGSAEEALAVAVDLWAQLTAMKTDEKELRRGRSNENRRTCQMLNAGQIMAIESALTRHLQRHAHLVPRKAKGD
jgi:hypothetical protein